MLKQGGTICAWTTNSLLPEVENFQVLPEGRYEESHDILPLLTYGGKCEGNVHFRLCSPSNLLKIYVSVATENMWTDNCPRFVRYNLTLRIGVVS